MHELTWAWGLERKRTMAARDVVLTILGISVPS